jgi:hypothetical protein
METGEHRELAILFFILFLIKHKSPSAEADGLL